MVKRNFFCGNSVLNLPTRRYNQTLYETYVKLANRIHQFELSYNRIVFPFIFSVDYNTNL